MFESTAEFTPLTFTHLSYYFLTLLAHFNLTLIACWCQITDTHSCIILVQICVTGGEETVNSVYPDCKHITND